MPSARLIYCCSWLPRPFAQNNKKCSRKKKHRKFDQIIYKVAAKNVRLTWNCSRVKRVSCKEIKSNHIFQKNKTKCNSRATKLTHNAAFQLHESTNTVHRLHAANLFETRGENRRKITARCKWKKKLLPLNWTSLLTNVRRLIIPLYTFSDTVSRHRTSDRSNYVWLSRAEGICRIERLPASIAFVLLLIILITAN